MILDKVKSTGFTGNIDVLFGYELAVKLVSKCAVYAYFRRLNAGYL